MKTIALSILEWLWSREPQWLKPYDEFVAGLCGIALPFLFNLITQNVLVVLLLTYLTFNNLSVYYEQNWDPHGWQDGKDCRARLPGLGVAMLIWIGVKILWR